MHGSQWAQSFVPHTLQVAHSPSLKLPSHPSFDSHVSHVCLTPHHLPKVVTARGRFVVSAGDDACVRVWDLTGLSDAETPSAHTARVRQVRTKTFLFIALCVACFWWCICFELVAVRVCCKPWHQVLLCCAARCPTNTQRCRMIPSDFVPCVIRASARPLSFYRCVGPSTPRPTLSCSCCVCPVQLVALPGGSRLVSASDDGTIAVWDAASGEVAQKAEGHKGAVLTLAVASSPGNCVFMLF